MEKGGFVCLHALSMEKRGSHICAKYGEEGETTAEEGQGRMGGV